MDEPGPAGTGRNGRPPVRVCSGACPFFEPLYDLGRKIAGTGACEKHGGEHVVRVGNPCLWPKLAKPELASAAAADLSGTLT